MPLASVRALEASFANTVRHIVGMGAEPEVVGVYARGHIALVEHIHAVRYRSSRQLVSHAMRSALHSVDRDLSVTVLVSIPEPQPAPAIGLRLVLFVESFLECFHRGSIA
jgi:hypothetical protein